MAGIVRRQSIAVRLFASSALWSLIILVVAGVILSSIYRTTTEHAFDERLHVYLKSLVADVAAPGDQDAEPSGLGEPRFDLPLSGWYWQITRLDKSPHEVRGSTSLFGGRLSPLPDEAGHPKLGELREGYIVGPDERRLRSVERVVDLGDDGRFHIQVAADADEIDQSVVSFRWAVGTTFLLLGLALVLTTLFQVRFGLLPLARLSGAVGAVRRGEADRIGGEYPHDIAPLATELNLLIDANREILERARTQVGNLAHALKTPLSVIVNEADAAPGQLADKVAEQAKVMRDQVSWYLDRARAAARAGSIGTATEVAPALDALIRTFAKIYADRRIEFSADAEPEARFRGEKQDFEEMVGNLLDNAGKWASSRVNVEAGLLPADGVGHRQVRIAIEDDGPGLKPEQREQAVRRGRRLDESRPGSGLGLSIVADLASLYGGALTLEEASIGGLRAVLVLPGV